MPPRRPRSAVATAPLQYLAADTAPMDAPKPRKSTTAQLRLPPSRRRKQMRLRTLFRVMFRGSLVMGLCAVTLAAAAFGYSQAMGGFQGVKGIKGFELPALNLGGLGIKGFSNNDLARGLMPLSARQNILLMGTDYSYAEGKRVADGPVRSDTMMVASMDPATHKLTILSIPRDTRVLIHGHYDKINGAYAIGGADLAMKTVSNLLGVPITRWAQVNTTGLEHIVDVMGGVRVYAEKDMYYVDETAHLGINIHKGWHLMNGKQAHQFVRFRHDEMGDIGRVQRQQQFLRAAAGTMLTPTALMHLPQVLETVKQNITTNLDGGLLVRLGAWSLRLGRADVKMVMLPGAFSGKEYTASYWLVDPQAAQSLGRRLLANGADGRQAERAHVKLTVLNGTHEAGAATAVAHALHEAGWTIYTVGESPRRDYLHTKVINQIGQDALAKRIGQDLGVGTEVEDSSVGDVASDFTVVVGEDWERTAHLGR